MQRLADLAASLHLATPPIERVLALVGLSYTAVVAVLDAVSGWVSVGVGLATITMILPRAIIGWSEVAAARSERRRRREDAMRLLREVESECEGCAPERHPLPDPAPVTPAGQEKSTGS